jgi:hypothetical protein
MAICESVPPVVCLTSRGWVFCVAALSDRSRMPTADIAIASCRRLSTSGPTHLYPDPQIWDSARRPFAGGR